jgi:hypothetical protein
MGIHPVAAVVDLYKKRKDRAQREKQHTKQYINDKKHRTHKIKIKNTNKNKYKKNIKNISPEIRN